MSRQDIEKSFPNLSEYGYTITSPETVEYNCIAWAAGDTTAWWWPDDQYQYYWPSEIPRRESIETFIKAYETLGYSLCDNAEIEDSLEKIAIYVDSNRKPTHAARQLSNNLWTSKLGRLEDIEHSLDGFLDSIYGSVAVIMKRPRK